MLIVDIYGLDDISVTCKYSTSYIDRLRQVPGSRFDQTTKNWIFPYSSLKSFEDLFRGEIVWKTPEWQIKSLPIPDVSKMYKVDDSIQVPSFKIKAYDYQNFGIKFMVDRIINTGFVFNTDAVGLGKTLQALGAMVYAHENLNTVRFILLCKKSIKFQWKQEIIKFTDLDKDLMIEYIPEQATPKQRQKIYDRCQVNGKFILITTYQSSLNDKEEFKKLKADMLIVDEAHILRNRTGEMNKAVRYYGDKIPYKIFLTGTPLMTKPVDIFGLMQIADKKYLGKWSDFEDTHVRYEMRNNYLDEVGYKELDLLRDKVQNVLIRRTENEVSIQMPSIVHKQIDVPKDKVQEKLSEILKEKKQDIVSEIEALALKLEQYKLQKYSKGEEDVTKRITMLDSSMKGLIASDQAIADDPRLFNMTSSKMIKDLFAPSIPKNYSGSPKTSAIIEQIEEILSQNEKVVVFSKYVRYVDLLAEEIEKKLGIKVLRYHGQMNGDSRVKAIEDFALDPNDEYPVIVMTDAGSEGLNLQAARHQFNCDLPDSPAIKTQRMGRIRRASSVYAKAYTYDFITEDSFDTEKLKTLERAKNLFDGIVEIDQAQSNALKDIMK